VSTHPYCLPQISAKDSFEIAFNVACGLVDAGQLRAAEEQLQLAVRVGEEALYDEDLAEADVAAELAPVTAQLAYVAERLGRQEEAAASYEAVLGLALEDATTASGAVVPRPRPAPGGELCLAAACGGVCVRACCCACPLCVLP
jgi:hypothetical protein